MLYELPSSSGFRVNFQMDNFFTTLSWACYGSIEWIISPTNYVNGIFLRFVRQVFNPFTFIVHATIKKAPRFEKKVKHF